MPVDATDEAARTSYSRFGLAGVARCGDAHELLIIPATIGEVWIMAYLIIVGARGPAPVPEEVDGVLAAPFT